MINDYNGTIISERRALLLRSKSEESYQKWLFYVLSLGVRDYHFELLAVRRVKKVRNHCLNSYTFEEHESDHFFRSGRQTKVKIKN